MCFLCLATFKSWSAVWKHSNSHHGNGPMWPLRCPKCHQQGKESLQHIKNLGKWCGYVHKHYSPIKQEPFRCLMGCKIFNYVCDLTTHLKNNQKESWTTSKEFPCPKCRRLDTEDHIFNDPVEFCPRPEFNYGSKHLPAQPPQKTLLHSCPLCNKEMFPTKAVLSRQTTVVYREVEKIFVERFPCPKCRLLDLDDHIIRDVTNWCRYVAEQCKCSLFNSTFRNTVSFMQ